MNAREEHFATIFFDHREWKSHPKSFTLAGGCKYTPDFIDERRETYIEVIGSRQAFHQNKVKYAMFFNAYPNVPLEFRKFTGELKTFPEGYFTGLPYAKKRKNHMDVNSKISLEVANLIRLVCYLNAWSLVELSKKTGIPNGTLGRVVRHLHPATENMKDKVIKFLPASIQNGLNVSLFLQLTDGDGGRYEKRIL